jgi:hypothetical protein
LHRDNELEIPRIAVGRPHPLAVQNFTPSTLATKARMRR